MRESSLVVGEGREDVDTIALSLEQIRSAVSEAATRAEEIFEGADTQTMDVQRIVGSIDEIAKVGERNSEAISGVSATSRGQMESTEQMVGSSQALNQLAAEMRELLRRLDTGHGGERTDA